MVVVGGGGARDDVVTVGGEGVGRMYRWAFTCIMYVHVKFMYVHVSEKRKKGEIWKYL